MTFFSSNKGDLERRWQPSLVPPMLGGGEPSQLLPS